MHAEHRVNACRALTSLVAMAHTRNSRILLTHFSRNLNECKMMNAWIQYTSIRAGPVALVN